MSKKYTIAIVVTYIFISHIALPVFNNQKDFLFFSTWKLFSENHRSSFFEISWLEKNERKFFFRDYSKSSKNMDIDIRTLFWTLRHKQDGSLSPSDIGKIKKVCQCQNFEIIEIFSSMGAHFFKNEEVQFKSVKRI